MKLDEYDMKILDLLSENSRLSYSEIGKILGLARQTVKSRIERLEKEGIIEKYTIKISPAIDTRKTFFLLIESENMPDEFPEVYRVGKDRYLVKAVIATPDSLSEYARRYKVVEILPVIEYRQGKMTEGMEVVFRCDYCGKELREKPIVYKRHNKLYVFCCPTCLDMFRESNYDG
ncbi:Transcriptional regulator [Geoglobus ahangari]|uniref:Transcriptional regulator n=1 Tax=Geoglobus ahangari TaxID=113653 RepID=A0A0F7IGB9_9EURY|nr:winged helix-turn-helix transcriptional regulator [Geoglobus ahangari]AKG90919.1 Transcriptional regulator [Geoglobus ahangari]